MKSIYKIILLLIFVCPVGSTQAQSLPSTIIHVNTDQRIYITGETVWIDGWIENFSASKIIHLKLIDRFGKKRQEIHLKNEKGNFKGFITIPNELYSDFYFVEASAAGFASVQQLHPIMVINPASAASACNEPTLLKTKTSNDQQPFSIKTEKKQFSSREKVKVELNGLDSLTHLNICVSKKDEITDYMDSLLSFQMPILQHPAKGIAEMEGHHLKIKIVSNSTALPMQRVRACAAAIGGQASLSSALSNQKGEVEFILPLMQQEASLVFFAEKQFEDKVRILTAEEEDEIKPISFPCLQLNNKMAVAIEDRIWNSKSGFLYQGKDRWTYKDKNQDSSDFYGKPDKRYLLDEYVRYPLLEEVIAEFIHEARVKEAGNNNEKTIQVLNTPAKAFFNSQALILLDGIPVLNAGKLLDLNPLLIQSIDVISRKYYLGDTTWNGIIHFKTYNRDLSEYKLPSAFLLYPFKGLQENAYPIYQQSQNVESRMPVLSNVLFNQTTEFTKKSSLQLEFITNDALGVFQITGTGTNTRGENVKTHINIDVKPNR